MKRLVLLGLFLAGPAAALTPELQGVEETIERIGTKVLWSMGYPECRQGILGFYRPSIDTVIICQGNHRRNVAELVSQPAPAVGFICNLEAVRPVEEAGSSKCMEGMSS